MDVEDVRNEKRRETELGIMKNRRRKLGDAGEALACEHLLALGHTVLERNWTYAHLEVDIITLSGDGLHFVEVKTRTAPSGAEPEESVGLAKQRKLVAAAEAFVHKRGNEALKENQDLHFDVFSVIFERESVRVRYIPEAFIPIFYSI
ncbi:MAG: YraN family protein [Bacteroidia bacterium]|nr:YraN family protein [Bacteroidia bacterium]